VIPRMVTEKTRLYEFIVILLKNGSFQGTNLEEKHGMDLIEKLQCKFADIHETKEIDKDNDFLSQAIEEMFAKDKDNLSDTETHLSLVIEDNEDVEDSVDVDNDAQETGVTNLHK
jgi:hypothetical protein